MMPLANNVAHGSTKLLNSWHIHLFESDSNFHLRKLLLACVDMKDLISGLVVSVVDPQPGDTIIDCCAAPGGKTLFMASRLSRQGKKMEWRVGFNVQLFFFLRQASMFNSCKL